MILQDFAHRLSRKARIRLWSLAGRDELTRTRLRRVDDLIRLGTRYGGWTIPDKLLGRGSICYCAGCGEDISFDLGLIDRYGCEVYSFDPTPRAITHVTRAADGLPSYHFSDFGLWEKDDTLKFYAPKNPQHVSHSLLNLQKTESFIEVKVRRLSNIMKDRGHHSLDILKLDIEGAEYKVIDSMLEDNILVRILCVEFDEYWHPLDLNWADRIRTYVDRLSTNGYVMVHSSGNGNYTFQLDR